MRDERHNTLTEQERRTRDAIRSSGEVRADAAFRERLKREFRSGTISEPAVPRQESRARSFPRWSWVLIPAAAVILLFAIFFPRTSVPEWSVQAVHGEGRIEIEGQVLATDEQDLVSQLLSAGGRVRLPEEVALDLRLDDRLILALAEGSDVTLPVPLEPGSRGPLVSEVHHGELRIMTGPGFPGIEMHILTTEGRTEISGTIISVYKGDSYTCVCVLEGTALIGADENQLEEVAAGNLMVMFEDGSPPVVADIEAGHVMDLLKFGERYRGIFEPPD